MARYVFPLRHGSLDPDCPEVARCTDALFYDPMTRVMGAPVDDIMEMFERRHRAKCPRCQEYGAANVEVE
jgi:hypothetical protein